MYRNEYITRRLSYVAWNALHLELLNFIQYVSLSCYADEKRTAIYRRKGPVSVRHRHKYRNTYQIGVRRIYPAIN